MPDTVPMPESPFAHIGGTDPTLEGWTRLSDDGSSGILEHAHELAGDDRTFDFMVDGKPQRAKVQIAAQRDGELWAAIPVSNDRLRTLAHAKDAIVCRLAMMLRAGPIGQFHWRGFWSKTVHGQEAIAACGYVDPVGLDVSSDSLAWMQQHRPSLRTVAPPCPPRPS